MLTIDAQSWNALPNRLARMARLCEAFVGAPQGFEVCVEVHVHPEQGLRSRAVRGVQRFNVGPRHRVLYVSEREFFAEVRDASLAVARAEHRRYIIHRGPWGPPTPAAPSTQDIATVGKAVRACLMAGPWLRELGPNALIMKARALGRNAPSMGAAQRLRVREVVAAVDRLTPGPRGCLRRVVAECMLVREAAADVVCLGLNVRSTGHAYFEGDATSPNYDVTTRLEAAP